MAFNEHVELDKHPTVAWPTHHHIIRVVSDKLTRF